MCNGFSPVLLRIITFCFKKKAYVQQNNSFLFETRLMKITFSLTEFKVSKGELKQFSFSTAL